MWKKKMKKEQAEAKAKELWGGSTGRTGIACKLDHPKGMVGVGVKGVWKVWIFGMGRTYEEAFMCANLPCPNSIITETVPLCRSHQQTKERV